MTEISAAGADPNRPMSDTTRPIHAAAFMGADAALAALAGEGSAGVDVDVPKRAGGSTALHMAAQEGRESTVR